MDEHTKKRLSMWSRKHPRLLSNAVAAFAAWTVLLAVVTMLLILPALTYYWGGPSPKPLVHLILIILTAAWIGSCIAWYKAVTLAEQRLEERDATAAALRMSEERYRLLMEELREPLAVIKDYRHVFVNPAYCNLVGYDDYELLRSSIDPVLAPEDRQSVIELFAKTLAGGLVPAGYETRLLDKQGRLIWVEILARVMEFQGGRAIQASFHNIQDRREAEVELRESEAKFRSLTDQSIVSIAIIQEWRCRFINPAFARLMETVPEELYRMSARQVLSLAHPDDREMIYRQISDCEAGAMGEVKQCEYRLVMPDSRIKWVEQYSVRIVYGGRPAVLLSALEITQRKQALAALGESEERYRRLLNDMHDAAFLGTVSPEGRHGRFIEANVAACKLFGYSHDELSRLTPYDLAPPGSEAKVNETLGRLIGAGGGEFRARVCAKDGRIINIEGHCHLMEAQGERLMFTLLHDITERIFTENMMLLQRDLATALSATAGLEASLRLIIHAAMGVSDTEVGVVYLVDEKSGDLFLATSEGLPADLRGLSRHYPADSPQARYALEGLPFYTHASEVKDLMGKLGDYAKIRAIALIPVKHGERVIACLNLASLKLDQIGPESQRALEAVASQIGPALARARAEAALRESEERYRELVETMEEGILILDESGGVLFCNPAAGRLIGKSAEEIIGSEVRELLPEEEQDGIAQLLALRRAGISTTFELRLPTADGDVKQLLVHGRPYFDTKTRQSGSFSLIQDITARKQTEQALFERDAQLGAVIESFDGLMYIASSEYRIEYMNQRFIDRIGRDATGEFCYEALCDLGGVCEWCMNDRVFHGETVRYEMWSPRFERWYLVVDSPIRRPDRRVSKLALIIDVTERKLAESALTQQQREESIATLAGGIAHDFNNILMGVMGSASLLKDTFPPGHPGHEITDLIVTSAHRMSDLTAKLLAYARGGKHQPVAVDVNSAIQDCLAMTRGSRPTNVDTNLILFPKAWPVEADPGQLNQVVLNLVVNAYEAMAEHGGTLTILTENVSRQAWHCMRHQHHPAGDYVVIRFSDTGPGIDQERLGRIFEPFFSTKAQGRGLGLAAVQGIIRSHGGCIIAESIPGQGTQFTLHLPRSLKELATEHLDTPHATQGSETILLVDDEQVVLSVASRMLERRGFRVLTASDASHALECFGELGDQVDLVLIDIQMPGMDGLQLLRELRRRRPDLRAVLSSGLVDSHNHEDNFGPAPLGYVQKPYSLDELVLTVRNVLDT